MAVRKSKLPHNSSVQANETKLQQRANSRQRVRRLLNEHLEPRQLMAVGPQLIGIQPNGSDLLIDGAVRSTSPRELVFRFDDVQQINPATLAGIRLTAAGGDGHFGLAAVESDFGSNGAVSIQLAAYTPGRNYTVSVTASDLGAGVPPTVSLVGSNLSINLNSRVTSRTTASQLIQAINTSAAGNEIFASYKGGHINAQLAMTTPTSPLSLNQTNDRVITPGAILVGQSPNENEVTMRFAETLKDDQYRIEVFGFDDPARGVVGLRNSTGQLFRPAVAGTRKDTINFRLDLGTQVAAVVPQPVYREGAGLRQERDTVVVYFDSDKLLVENDANGRPTQRSVENPAFYQLIYSADTVRNTDDRYETPTSVRYNALTNTATLKFRTDLNDLHGPNAGPITYRLRIGTRESAPFAPRYMEAAATAVTDLNTNQAVRLQFIAKQPGASGNGIQVAFVNSGSGTPDLVINGRTITIDFGRDNLTANELISFLQTRTDFAALVSVEVLAGSNLATVVGNTNLAFSPVTLFGLGGTTTTAMNLGPIGSAAQTQTSLILGAAIEPMQSPLDLPGASDDAAHRRLLQGISDTFEDHVNPLFSADSIDGVQTIYYNFRSQYAQDISGATLTNSITETQKRRAREVIALWSNYIGVQFVETADRGITIATGDFANIAPVGNTQAIIAGQGSVRIDPTFENSAIVMSATFNWGNLYGESFTRSMAAAMGFVLGLARAGDLPATELARFDPFFLAGNDPLVDGNNAQLTANDERYEPIFPGNQDILHARFLHRPDSTDVDLYRFEVDFGGSDRVGVLVAETYAQRLTNSSELDSNLQLFRETNASGQTSFNVTGLNLKFTSMLSGTLGNQFLISLTQTELPPNTPPSLQFSTNAINIDLNSTLGSETTVQEVIDLIRNSPEASRLIKVELTSGNASTKIGRNLLVQNPIRLLGGGLELIAQNDDYFSRDSYLTRKLGSGVYYIGVSASGNSEYNPAVEGSGSGGRTQGEYQLRINFKAEVDPRDTIQDMASMFTGDVSVGLDGDADGSPGGVYNFWFQTRPLNRTLSFNAGANPDLEGRIVTVVGANGTSRIFEFSADAAIQPGRHRIFYASNSNAASLAQSLADAINARTELGVTAIASGLRLTLIGERSITIDPNITLIEVGGRMIFVDKAAGANGNGTQSAPFNNIAGTGVANAFASALPGDIVRIVTNGGTDNNVTTTNNNLAYEIGRGPLTGSILTDGVSMDIPRGVTTMIDAGAIFKLNGAAITAGSSNLSINRNGAVLQVLGTPMLLDAAGNAIRNSDGTPASGRVTFTSWFDESIGLDNFSPTTTPARGNWGGLFLRRDVDSQAGRKDLEEEAIFLNHINYADIRYGGGTVNVDSVPQVVNPVQMLATRATITNNLIRFSSSAAMSADPASFEETNFNEPRFQLNGAFTSDYSRVGPEIHGNMLTNNSINGLFISVDTPADGLTRTLTVPGRFDDTDVVHVLTSSLILSSSVGGSLLDGTTPQVNGMSLAPAAGGILSPEVFNYKVTFVDRNGYESIPSDASVSIALSIGSTAVRLAGLPGATGDFVSRRLYRSSPGGNGPYQLVANLDRLSSTFLDVGQTPGGVLSRDRLDISMVGTQELPLGGTLAAGAYNYRIVLVDSAGREGLASNVTTSITVANGSAIRLTQLPQLVSGFVARRIYRSNGLGSYVLVGELTGSASSFTDTGAAGTTLLSQEALGIRRPRLNASLVIDPGTVLKMEAARIEAQMGTNIIAEGVDGLPIVFTSRLDDTVGVGGTFDTNDNGASTVPNPRDWGGIYAAPTSSLSIDHARFSYGGGVTSLDGTFRAFNTIEIHQASARIANSVFEDNANGMGGQGPGTRLGRLSNSPATIFVRGAQPTIVGNVFRDNAGSAIRIDVNSMTDTLLGDPGRQTGAAERNLNYIANRGPLIRENRLQDNGLNGLEIRGGTLTTGSVWDDTDIVHVSFDPIFTGNIQHTGGLRLQSSPTESLVVKFDGYGSNYNRNIGAGITANGQLTSASDRVGGTLHIVGQPGFPVILTSLKDDTVGAGLQPNGLPQTDTNADGIGSIPQAADWRGILIDQYANDRNVAIVLELEDFRAAAPGPNGTTTSAQVLGDLAASTSASSENLRLGFVVEGVLSQAEDVDVYSFSGVAGTEVWLDIDYTKQNLDTVLELLDANGNLLVRSVSSTEESDDPSKILTTSLIPAGSANPLNVRQDQIRLTASGRVKEDGTTNINDPGIRIRLPGSAGVRSTFYFRVRSRGLDVGQVGAGLSAGAYQVQVRLREAQEWAGSTVSFADIRYAMNGVHLRGMPGDSPLIGEAAEDESVGNGQFTANNGVATGNGRPFSFGNNFGNPNWVAPEIGNRPQYLGNILNTAKGAISVAGNLSSASDLDYYMIEVRQEDLVGGLGATGYAPVVFDIDYADGLNRPDTILNIFRQERSTFRPNSLFPTDPNQFQYRLVYSSADSNVADDQPRPLAGTDMADLSRGSAGTRDPFIGPVALQEGVYLVAVSSSALRPRTLVLNPGATQPINSVRRIVDTGFIAGVTTADPPVVTNFLPQTNVQPGTDLVSQPFNLGAYAAGDLPTTFLTYQQFGGQMELYVRDAANVDTLVATSANLANITRLQNGAGQISLAAFAGQDNLRLVYRSTGSVADITRTIIGFAERGLEMNAVNEPILLNNAFLFGPFARQFTRTFSLQTYSLLDNPSISFGYQVFQGELDVFVNDQFGGRTRVATTVANQAGPTEVVLITGSPQTALISLARWVGQPGLTVEFQTRDAANSSTVINNAYIELADGSRVFSGEPNPTFTPVPVPSTTITSGAYQLEVRLGDTFFEKQTGDFGPPLLTQSFDTNDRLADGLAIRAPAGSTIAVGDRFSISDGGNVVVFEFTQTGAVSGLGSIPIRYQPTDANFVVARAIRDAINSPAVQSRLQVRSATSSGIASGTTGRDPWLNLFGNATVKTIQAANGGEVVQFYSSGRSDRNVTRDQGQVIIQNSFIRNSRDYGVWSEPAGRLQDPRDIIPATDFLGQLFRQDLPALAGTQAVRNLLVANNSVAGGLLPGLVIQNNVLEAGGLGGINISGENPIWMISPQLVPTTDPDPTVNTPGSHFGFYLDDGDILVVDSDRTRLRFEFEDLAGGATGGPTFGSGQVEGNGYALDTTIAWYRDQGGSFYQRSQGGNLQPFATTAYETMHALRDSVLGSILVSNGSTQVVRATIAESLMGPDRAATTADSTYGLYFNRPALFLEGVTNIQFLNFQGGGNPFNIRTLDLGQSPQPNARIINNTIVGKDGRAGFNGESPLAEDNDTIAGAVQTWQGTGIKPLVYSEAGVIGDGGIPIAGSTSNRGTTGTGSGGAGGGGNGGNSGTTSFNQDQFLVRFKANVSAESQAALLASQGLVVLKRYDFVGSILVGIQPGPVVNIIDKISALRSRPEIESADPDFAREFTRAPNDPRYGQQWHYDNVGQTGGTVDADIDLPEAWDLTVGSTQVVMAVLDSGIDYNHPDLRANMWVNTREIPGNGIDDDGNGYIDDIYGIDSFNSDSDPMDDNGHGTHVAGTMGAVGNNNRGVTGVNWNARLMALKIGSQGGGISTAAVIEALNYMVMMKTAHGVNIVVSNNSYGGFGFSAAEQAAIQATIDAGIVFVAASGNNGVNIDNNPFFPASYPLDGIISVGASDHNDRVAGFSNFGVNNVDLVAPGVDILSTTLGGGYGLNSGTSMASPHVAGVVGLVAGYQPQLTVSQLKSTVLLAADPVDGLQGTSGTEARLNAFKSLLLASAPLTSTTDVDIYQFKLGIGERVFVDVDTQNSGLQAALQIFDSRGIPQQFTNFRGETVLVSGTEGPNGSWVGVDPTADFTALKPGVYYAAVSSVGNTTFDPLSKAGRKAGTSTGAYRISIDARTLQDFVIVAENASNYTNGQTFTIHGVPDSDLTGTTGVTFQFVFGFLTPPTNPSFIPINLDPNWRYPDVARAIAKAINEGNAGGPAISNAQQLPNGNLTAASPLPPAHAQALGGLTGVIDAPLNTIVGDLEDLLLQFGAVDELGTNVIPKREVERQITGPVWQTNQGLRLFPRRPDGIINIVTTSGASPRESFTHTQITTLSHLGMGHDRLSTTPLSFTSRADGTMEKFVVVKNVAFINGNGSILVGPDIDDQNNLNQLIPETGVLATRGASPIILNNTFFNVQTPVVNEESRRFPITGGPAPYGSNNPNFPIKPGQVTLAGSIYQYHETSSSASRFATGIEASPTNVPNTALDFNTIVPATTRLFVNAQAGNYLPAPGSPLIDSAIDLIPENSSLAVVKSAMGLAVSPVIAPATDAFGQLRTDDPLVAPPQGQGQNVFKDRGALDRADFIGPAAILLKPTDNDAQGVDRDPAEAVVQLASGVYSEFRIQLKDGNEPANPLFGLGIDDNSVVGPTIDGLRALGASTVVIENGRMLVEGIDYRFAYNSTTDEIILTPLAGVWKQGAVYEITINNRNRFVISAVSGDQVADGDSFTIADENGGVNHFQFESGYSLRVPQNLSLQVPLAGTTFGGITDSERFTISIGGQPRVFEFDLNSNVLAGSIPIALTPGASQQSVVTAIIAAINGANLGVTASDGGNGSVILGADTGVRVDTNSTTVQQLAGTLALQVPANALRGGVRDGQTIQLNDGKRSVTFEFDSDGTVQTGNVAISIANLSTIRDLTLLIQSRIASTSLNVNPSLVADDLLYLGLPVAGTVSSASSLVVVGVSRTLRDGQILRVQNGATSVNFEFTRDAIVTPGNVAIPVSNTDTQNQIAQRIVQAIVGANLGLQPRLIGSGNILIGGTSATLIDVSQATDLTLVGRPGFDSSTRLEIFGQLLMEVPLGGASRIVEGGTFVVRGNGRTVRFEFDSDFNSTPGNTVVRYTTLSTANDIAIAIVNAINAAGLGLTPRIQSGNIISLGLVADSTLDVGNSGLTSSRGLVTDGETFTIANGPLSVTFEFDNALLNNGVASGNQPILFTPTSTVDSVLNSMRAAINASGLGLASVVLPGNILALNDKPTHTIDVSAAPTLIKTGVPGGATPIYFVPDASFTAVQMKQAIVDAINGAANTNLSAVSRGGNTLFVSGAISVSPEIDNFFLRGVEDLAGNFLKSNQIDNETRFTILMPGIALDFGDAPDPVSGTLGRYPTLFASDGARHVISNTAILGQTITAEADGLPSSDAAGDSDDGVQFGTNYLIPGLFNKFIQTPITVTLNSPGRVDAWIDWNADGDWDDPNEQILTAHEFGFGQLTQTFMVTVPASVPNPSAVTTTYARFRSSSVGGLGPRGLAVDGEVEDYEVKIAPGTPPQAVNDVYSVNEDGRLLTTDATGRTTPNFTIDDGVAANDVDPDSASLGVVLIQGPSNAALFRLESNGTFEYVPAANFFGIDTFTYRVNDGILNSNNIGTVTINVQEVNDPPIPADDTFNTNEDQPLVLNQSLLMANDSAGINESNQVIQVTRVQAVTPNGGSVTLVNGIITYTPAPDFHGTDTFTYTITDNGRTGGVAAPLSATATVTIIVAEVNDPPVVPLVNLEVNEDTSLPISGASLIAGAVPGPADERAWQAVRLSRVNNQSQAGGTVSWNTTTNQIVYTPSQDFAGVDFFVFDVVDFSTDPGRTLVPRTTTGTVSITVNNTNDSPIVQNPFGTITLLEDQSARVIELNQVFSDPDIATANDILSYEVLSVTPQGLITTNISNGQLILQLLPDQNGQVRVVVRATDLSGLSVQDTLTVNITPVNDPPRVSNPLPDITVNKNGTIPSRALSPAHFVDPDIANGDVLTFRIVSNSNPLLVTPTISGGSLNLSLIANQFGTSVITVSATDSVGETVADEFTLTVVNVNEAPVGVADTYRVPQGTLLTVAADRGVLANDRDPEGNTMQARLVRQPNSASQFTLNPNGSFTYLHNSNAGRTTDSFVYRAFDGSLESQDVTVTIIIDAPPPPSHQNPLNRLDVSADGNVSPIDALLIINLLNDPDAPRSVSLLPPPPAFYDVDGNGIVTPNDALEVINFLNSRSLGSGEGEGAGLFTPQLVSRSLDNQVIRMSNEPAYGPLLPEGEGFSLQAAEAAQWVDLSWIDRRSERTAAEDDLGDLALSELMEEFL